MGKSALDVWGDLDQSQLYGEFWQVMKKSGMLGVTNCSNAPDMFFPDMKNYNSSYQDVQTAKRACKSCPLLDACATYAIVAHEREGIWGSLSPYEREGLRKQIKRHGGVQKFIEKGYLKYFRLKAKVEQIPRKSSLIDED